MDVEDVHENAYLEGAALQIGVIGLLDHNDAAVGGRNDALGPATGDLAGRIAEELDTEDEDHPEGQRPGACIGSQQGNDQGGGDEGPAFLGDKGMRIVHG